MAKAQVGQVTVNSSHLDSSKKPKNSRLYRAWASKNQNGKFSSNLCVRNGSYEANRKEVHQRKSFEKATCHESSTQVRSGDRRHEEAAPFQAKYGGAEGDPKVPEEHQASHKEASFPETHKGNRSGLQDQSLLPQQRRLHSPRSRRGLPRCALRGHQPLHHSPKRVTIMPKD
ncbi:hypothetical protein JHK87_048047 [Glycine soja]|nr:hypothetical protein JHK87_048047 [Glycine soja]